MDKRIIFAVAGSGKTTEIVESLSKEKRSLIVTYTISNFNILSRRILKQFGGKWPKGIKLFTYFQFLYHFCYKPFLADDIKAKGITYTQKGPIYIKQSKRAFYLSPSRYLYHNRLSYLFFINNVIDDIKNRIHKYYDEFIIDEVQDIGGRDFDFLEAIMTTSVDMLFVGDFYQHTYDTSRDGNANKNLYNDFSVYKSKFTNNGFIDDSTSLIKSWRCSKNICEYVSEKLGINILSHRDPSDNTNVFEVFDINKAKEILCDPNIIKLHRDKSDIYGPGHYNWGEIKGEEFKNDICVLLNKKTAKFHAAGKLKELPPISLNKLYVALTRSRGNVFVIYESFLDDKGDC